MINIPRSSLFVYFVEPLISLPFKQIAQSNGVSLQKKKKRNPGLSFKPTNIGPAF
jgi:hypothetical protein